MTWGFFFPDCGRRRRCRVCPSRHRVPSTALHRLRNVGAAVRPGSCSPSAQHRFAPLPGSQNVPRRGKAAAYTSQEPPERRSGEEWEVPALSAPLCPPGVVVLPPLWPLRGAWQGLGVPARHGRRGRGGKAGNAGNAGGCCGRCWGCAVSGYGGSPLHFLSLLPPSLPSRRFALCARAGGGARAAGPARAACGAGGSHPAPFRAAKGPARLGRHRDLPLRGASAQQPMDVLFPVPFPRSLARGPVDPCPEGLCGLWCGALCAVRAGPCPWSAVTEVSVLPTGGSRKTHRVCLSSTSMEEPTGNLPIRRDVILSESCCDHDTITNL